MRTGRANHRVSFDSFELDLHTRELYRGGEKLRLRGQPIDLLEMLVQHPGELVTRQDIQKVLWPADTFVDFEHVLNNSVKRLREALGDSVDGPKYIETLPRLGYRFIGHVENNAPAESSSEERANACAVKTPEGSGSSANDATIESPTHRLEIRRGQKSRYWWFAVGSLLLTLSAGAALMWHARRPFAPLSIGKVSPITHKENIEAGALLGTDGERLYYERFSRSASCLNGIGGSADLVTIEISDGSLKTIPLKVPWPHESCVVLGPVSPDGSLLLAAGDDGGDKQLRYWLFSSSGAPIRSLGKLGFDPSWSIDGREILSATKDGQIQATAIDGSSSRIVASKVASPDGWQPFSIAESPDRKSLRFSRDDGIWQISATGEDIRKVANGMSGLWIADGAFYLFVSNGDLDSSQICALDERRGFFRRSMHTPIQLTSEPILWAPPLIISKDGRTVYGRGIIYQGELARLDKSSGVFRNFLGGISAEWLEFSPDGKSIAYVSFPDRKIWRANSDGGEKFLLAEPRGQAYGVHWSPDGNRILFGSWISSEHKEEIYIVPSRGGKPEQVALGETQATSDPTWSPDGRRLAFAITTNAKNHPSAIWIQDLKSGKSFALPESPRAPHSPRWSPDGRYIFALTHQDTDPGSSGFAEVFDFAQRKWTLLGEHADLHYPIWSRDSRFVYYLQTGIERSSSAVVQTWRVKRVSIPGGKIDTVVNLHDYQLIGAFGFSWLGLDSEDTPLVLHDISSDQIYSIPLEPGGGEGVPGD